MRGKKNEPDYEREVRTPYADSREVHCCCYCGRVTSETTTTKDHVPSIGIFDDDPPSLLPTARVCKKCNQLHSSDEQYFLCALSVALSGSPKPSEQKFAFARRVMENDKRIRRKISTGTSRTEDGNQVLNVDLEVVKRFLVKQARGHVYLELGLLRLKEPEVIKFQPSTALSGAQLKGFLAGDEQALWPDIGTRGFMRSVDIFSRPNGTTLSEDRFEIDAFGFVSLGKGEYRFKVQASQGEVSVRTVIWDYLFTEVRWEY